MKKIIEIFGVLVLGLIVIGVITTPDFFKAGFNNVIYTQVATALLMSCVSLVRAIRGEISNIFLVIIGFLCFGAGASVFLFYPEYFIAGTNLPMGMWHRLSFYALPSIALEGGIGTLLLAHLNRTRQMSHYGKTNRLLSLLFGLYTIHFVGLSFLVILGFAGVWWHMIIAKTMMGMVVVLQLIAWRNYSKHGH